MRTERRGREQTALEHKYFIADRRYAITLTSLAKRVVDGGRIGACLRQRG